MQLTTPQYFGKINHFQQLWICQQFYHPLMVILLVYTVDNIMLYTLYNMSYKHTTVSMIWSRPNTSNKLNHHLQKSHENVYCVYRSWCTLCSVDTFKNLLFVSLRKYRGFICSTESIKETLQVKILQNTHSPMPLIIRQWVSYAFSPSLTNTIPSTLIISIKITYQFKQMFWRVSHVENYPYK